MPVFTARPTCRLDPADAGPRGPAAPDHRIRAPTRGALQPGQVFVALKTDQRDGHDFLAGGAGRGRRAALVVSRAGRRAGPAAAGGGRSAGRVPGDRPRAPADVSRPGRRHHRQRGQDLHQGPRSRLLLGGAGRRCWRRRATSTTTSACRSRSRGSIRPVHRLRGRRGRDQRPGRDGAAGRHDRARPRDHHAGRAGAPAGAGRASRAWPARRPLLPAAVRAGRHRDLSRGRARNSRRFATWRCARWSSSRPRWCARPSRRRTRSISPSRNAGRHDGAGHRLRTAAAARLHAAAGVGRHGAERGAGDLRRPLARRGARRHPGAGWPRGSPRRGAARCGARRAGCSTSIATTPTRPRWPTRSTTFLALAPADEPRLYVLGCMEELGPRRRGLPPRLGRALRLRPGDRLFVIGDQAAAVREGAARGRHRGGADRGGRRAWRRWRRFSPAFAAPSSSRAAAATSWKRRWPRPRRRSPSHAKLSLPVRELVSARCACCGTSRCARSWPRARRR